MQTSASTDHAMPVPDLDVLVVGAGFAGLYLAVRLRDSGFRFQVLESGDDVGGTWYWNRYPGARCDVQTTDYSYSWDPQLERDWVWSEKYATQAEILRYLGHVADRHDLRRHVSFGSRVDAAAWDSTTASWTVQTSTGERLTARFVVMATGCLSVPKEIDVTGADRFQGEVYVTGRWPHGGVDFTGKRVAVIGTGSSGIQAIPLIAAQAASLTVFQRTANFSIPAHNGPSPADKRADFEADPVAYRASARRSGTGIPVQAPTLSALAVSDVERLATYEAAWERGGIVEFLATYTDHLSNIAANDLLAEFVRGKIRSIVDDPATAELLCPRTFPIGSKRLCVDSGYYATYNQPHVRLVDLRSHPITSVTETGIDLIDESLEFDAIVFATGFDAMTGAVVGVDIAGADDRSLRAAWAHGPETYLGLMANGFPNLFLVTGPGSPSVLCNMVMAIEQHVDWITDTLADLRSSGYEQIEPTTDAVDGWVRHVNDIADITVFPLADSWYLGANVPGKARVFLPYAGGLDRYRDACDEVRAGGYVGFTRRGPVGEVTTPGIVRELQPDVAVMLEMMAGLGLPSMDTMSAPDARLFSEATAAMRPPGPDVGEIVDATFPGPDGPLRYRLYRPATPGPHQLVVYFHGGGWVLGSEVADDPFCRDLCARTDTVVVSFDYRHAPEARFPAPVDDAFAALRWADAHRDELGASDTPLLVAGWSAGGNLAAVVCQLARDLGGPAIGGQVLVTPVTDSDLGRSSYQANGEGFLLTAPLMRWFFDHYVDEAHRRDPRVAPLRHETLAGLPPAVIVTGQFDPLRDEGAAYAAALEAAGVPVRHIQARGHIHTSIHAVDLLPSGAAVRAELAAAVAALMSPAVGA